MKPILFLCTGNTCRSPMAECLFNYLSQQKGLDIRALSAGIYGEQGMPASEGARAAMKARGLSLEGHEARSLSPHLLTEVSEVIAMTPDHVARCRERFPQLSLPIRAFSPPIPDPYGGSEWVYERTAEALEAQVFALLKESRA